MQIDDILTTIRRDRETYFGGSKSIREIRAFLMGFEIGCREAGGKGGAIMGELRPFSFWLSRELGVSASRGWCRMLLEKAGSDEQAYDLFFSYYDRYRATDPLPPVSPNSKS